MIAGSTTPGTPATPTPATPATPGGASTSLKAIQAWGYAPPIDVTYNAIA